MKAVWTSRQVAHWGWSLSWFPHYEVTRSITTPPWMGYQCMARLQCTSKHFIRLPWKFTCNHFYFLVLPKNTTKKPGQALNPSLSTQSLQCLTLPWKLSMSITTTLFEFEFFNLCFDSYLLILPQTGPLTALGLMYPCTTLSTFFN